MIEVGTVGNSAARVIGLTTFITTRAFQRTISHNQLQIKRTIVGTDIANAGIGSDLVIVIQGEHVQVAQIPQGIRNGSFQLIVAQKQKAHFDQLRQVGRNDARQGIVTQIQQDQIGNPFAHPMRNGIFNGTGAETQFLEFFQIRQVGKVLRIKVVIAQIQVFQIEQMIDGRRNGSGQTIATQIQMTERRQFANVQGNFALHVGIAVGTKESNGIIVIIPQDGRDIARQLIVVDINNFDIVKVGRNLSRQLVVGNIKESHRNGLQQGGIKGSIQFIVGQQEDFEERRVVKDINGARETIVVEGELGQLVHTIKVGQFAIQVIVGEGQELQFRPLFINVVRNAARHFIIFKDQGMQIIQVLKGIGNGSRNLVLVERDMLQGFEETNFGR
mmetsp:Transcript_26375/g.55131  ORF Transcript_26375/g.55131 Transcript_26375/m.55131 type:complete len:387 (-) Transcript_26375:539-1699(-)